MALGLGRLLPGLGPLCIVGASVAGACAFARWHSCGDVLGRAEEAAYRAGALVSGDDGPGFVEVDCERGDAGYDRIEEVEIAGPASAGDADLSGDGPPGLSGPRQGQQSVPARHTRQVRRKKMVAVPYSGGELSGSYLAELIADARTSTFARDCNEQNMAIASAYLKRRMVEHGVRPSHIARNLGPMVVAVFYRSNLDIQVEEDIRALKRVGRTRQASGAFW